MKSRVFWLCVLGSTTAVVVTAALAQPAAPRPANARAAMAVAAVEAAPTAPPARTPEDEARRARVIAKVGAHTITVGEVEDSINQQSPFMRVRFRDQAKLREHIDDLIRFELLAAESDRRGYGSNPSVVRTVKQNAVQQLIRREIDERVTVESIPAADVQTYYDGHPEEFHREEMVRASHILLNSRSDAAQLMSKVRAADTREFRQLARDRSVDTETKLRGGDLRYFTRNGRPPDSRDAPVDPVLVQATFALRDVGSVGGPVQVGDKWSIIRLTGRRPAEHRTLEEAEHGIRLRLWRERKQQAVEDLVASVRQRVPPELHEDRMAAIQLDPPPEAEGADPHGGPEKRPPGHAGPLTPGQARGPVPSGHGGGAPGPLGPVRPRQGAPGAPAPAGSEEEQ